MTTPHESSQAIDFLRAHDGEKYNPFDERWELVRKALGRPIRTYEPLTPQKLIDEILSRVGQ